jgi:hypothetical protein
VGTGSAVGCLKNVLAGIGCLVVLVAAAALAFIYRDRLAHWYRHARGIPEPPRVVYVLPGPGGATRAEAALRELSRRGGPAYVDIAPDALAALIDRELARAPRRVLDSVAVALGDGRVQVKGTLDVSLLPRRLLGPLIEGLGRREPVEAGGVLAAAPDGTVRWTLDRLVVREFPFPKSVIPAIVRSFGLADARDAAVPIQLPVPIGDVRVSPTGVRLYRASAR